MQTVLLEISDDVKDTVLAFLRMLPSDAVKIIEYDDKDLTKPPSDNLKTLLANIPEGLDDTDFERIRDFGREQPEWDI
ncbi:MAG: hypothetical protein Q8Q54_00660 [Methylococcales bacterium]|nr:hypothetical protein [Methylococcales bacterium]MDP3837412.1 hypothetical protein [Methylococcales bacterium]